MQNNQEEIQNLLHKIDQDTQTIERLQEILNFEQTSKKDLERRLQILEKERTQSSFEQTQILRERDIVVRDLSIELENTSQQLKTSVNENTDLKKKYRKFEQMYHELEEDFFKLKSKYEEIIKQVKDKDKELSQIQDVVEMYQSLKKDINLKRESKIEEEFNLYLQADKISNYYHKLKKDLEKDQQMFKKMLLKTSQYSLDLSYLKSEGANKDSMELKLIVLSQDNLLLKTEMLKLLKHMMRKEENQKTSHTAVKSFQEANKNQITTNNLKGSILSFSNNAFQDSTTEKFQSKRNNSFLHQKSGKTTQKLKRSSIINFEKFTESTTKAIIGSSSNSIQFSKNQCNFFTYIRIKDNKKKVLLNFNLFKFFLIFIRFLFT